MWTLVILCSLWITGEAVSSTIQGFSSSDSCNIAGNLAKDNLLKIKAEKTFIDQGIAHGVYFICVKVE